jgi:hypothetical protein
MPGTYFALLLISSASSSQSDPEEVHVKFILEPLQKYTLSFYGLKPVQIAQETERESVKTQDFTENA